MEARPACPGSCTGRESSSWPCWSGWQVRGRGGTSCPGACDSGCSTVSGGCLGSSRKWGVWRWSSRKWGVWRLSTPCWRCSGLSWPTPSCCTASSPRPPPCSRSARGPGSRGTARASLSHSRSGGTGTAGCSWRWASRPAASWRLCCTGGSHSGGTWPSSRCSTSPARQWWQSGWSGWRCPPRSRWWAPTPGGHKRGCPRPPRRGPCRRTWRPPVSRPGRCPPPAAPRARADCSHTAGELLHGEVSTETRSTAALQSYLRESAWLARPAAGLGGVRSTGGWRGPAWPAEAWWRTLRRAGGTVAGCWRERGRSAGGWTWRRAAPCCAAPACWSGGGHWGWADPPGWSGPPSWSCCRTCSAPSRRWRRGRKKSCCSSGPDWIMSPSPGELHH